MNEDVNEDVTDGMMTHVTSRETTAARPTAARTRRDDDDGDWNTMISFLFNVPAFFLPKNRLERDEPYYKYL